MLGIQSDRCFDCTVYQSIEHTTRYHSTLTLVRAGIVNNYIAFYLTTLPDMHTTEILLSKGKMVSQRHPSIMPLSQIARPSTH